MTSTLDLKAVSPERLGKAIAYNLGLVDILGAQVLQTGERTALVISPLTRRLILNALMYYRRALEGDNEDLGVPIIDGERGVHPLLDDHMKERAHYLKAEMLAQQSRDQGRAVGRAERQQEIDALKARVSDLVDEVDRWRDPDLLDKPVRARVKAKRGR